MSHHDTTTDRGARRGTGRSRAPRVFHTPVRGHVFATPPVGAPPLARCALRLRAEPDNPADRHAVAVWADDGARPWRIGYLERAVAVRVGPRLLAGEDVEVAFGGWWDEPDGRWQRPVVRVGAGRQPTPSRPRVSQLPPFAQVRTLPAISSG